MSKQVDERVVSMQFDNRQFEANVKSTMSLLERFKESLKFKGASNGLENVNGAAKKVDMTNLAKGVETVQAKFSALEVMGVTALANITNSAVNAGKKMVAALTIDPIKTGFSEYETQMNAVQTILANTQSKGSTLDDVNSALDTLNTYADKTIYNFTEMTRNIGTFTAAGVDLQTSVDSIQGIANLAAVSGSSSQQASTAMYQLSQALAAGRVSLMDWNSVVNAGMGGELFQNALIRTSELLKTGAKDAIKTHGSFRESLTKGQWLTTEVLTETLKQISGAYTEADLIAQGFTKEQAKEISSLAQTANDAATKVKTFSQLWDVMKESAQSGWAQTWKIIIGDFEQAKALLTPLADFFTGVIGKMSDARNKLLESALGKGFTKLADKINTVVGPAKKASEVVKNVTNTVSDLGDIIDKIMLGQLGNGKLRFDKLTESGHNYMRVQNKINEKLGDSFRYTDEQIAAQDKLIGKQKDSTEATSENVNETVELSDEKKNLIKTIAMMTEEEMRAKGYTDEQIEAFRELGATADKLGIPLNEFIDNMDQINGRWLLINSFKNIGKGLVTVLKSIGSAWTDVFPPMQAEQLFNMIAGFHKLTSKLVPTEETADKLRRTFKGLFAVLDIILTVVGGPIKIVFKALTQLLGMFDLNILDVTASIGDAIVGFRDFIDSTLDFTKIFEKIMPYLKDATKAIRDWAAGIKDADNIPKYIIQGLITGLKEGAIAVGTAALELGKRILESIKNFLGIHSPATKMIEVGRNIIAGLIEGIRDGLSGLWSMMKTVALKIVDFVKGIDWGAVLAIGFGAGMLLIGKKVVDIVESVVSPLEGLGDMFENLGDMFKNIGQGVESWFKAKAWNQRSKAMLNMAIAIGILAASVAVLTLLDTGKLWSAIGAIAALAAIMVALAFACNKLNGIGEINFNAVTILTIAGSLLLLSMVLQRLSSIELKDVPSVLISFTAMIVGLGGLMYAMGKFIKGDMAVNLDKVGILMTKMSFALLTMVTVVWLASKLNGGDIVKGIAVVAAIEVLFTAMIYMTKFAGPEASKVGGMLLKMSVALLIMLAVVRIAASLDAGEVFKGIAVVAALEVLFAGIILISKLAGKDMAKIGGTLLQVSAALLLMAFVIKIIAGLDSAGIIKGIMVITLFEGLFAALIAVSKFSGQHAAKAGLMLLEVAAALLVMTVVLVILKELDPEGLGRAMVVITMLSGILAGLIAVTYFAQHADKVKGMLITLTVTIGVLVAAIVALSLLDPAKVAVASASLSAVIGMFGLLMFLSQYLKSGQKTWKRNLATIAGMTLVVAALAGIIAVLSRCNPQAVISSAIGLSVLLAAMAVVMHVLGGVKSIPASAIGAMALLGLVVAELAIVLGVMSTLNIEASMNNVLALSTMLVVMSGVLIVLSLVGALGPMAFVGIGAIAVLGLVVAELALILGVMSALNIEASMNNVKALSTLLIVMSGVLVVLSIIGALGPIAFVGIGAIAVLGLVVAELAVILGLMAHFNVEPSIETSQALSLLLISMSGALVLLSLVGALGPAAFVGIAALATLITGIGGLIIGIGALMDKFPQLEAFLDKGIPVLEKIGYALGSFFGNIVGGFMGGMASGLPEVGAQLSAFMTNALPFINGVKMVDDSVMTGVSTLAKAVLALTAAELISSVATFLNGGASFAALGTELSNFMTNAQPFITASSGIDPAIMAGVKSLADTILVLTAADVLDGLTSWFTGGVSLASFGEQLAVFGPYIKQYADAVSGIDPSTVEASANAAKALGEMAANLPNSGGMASWFAGENDLAMFGAQLVPFGKALKDYSLAVIGIDPEAIKTSADAASGLSELASSIPNIGGMVSWFTGDNNMATFGIQLAIFGQYLKRYSDEVIGVDPEAIKNSVKAAEGLSELSDSIPNIGGMVTWFTGDNSLATFGAQLIPFGKYLKQYSESVSGISVSSITDSAKAVKELVKAVNNTANIDTSGVYGFKNAIATLAKTNVTDFVKAFSSSTSSLKSVGVDMIDAIAKGMESRKASLKNTAILLIDNMLKGIDASKIKFKAASIETVSQFINGLLSKKARIKTVTTSILSTMITSIRDYYSKFYSAGGYLVEGFARGINANEYKAEARSRAMAAAAAEAARKELDEHSPSKVGYKIGDFFGMAFVNAIAGYVDTAYSTSSEMASSAKKGLSDTIARIGDIVNSDIDTQPTIRPVLDLSNITSGASAISGLFGMRPSVEVMSSLGSIGYMMNRRQSANNDVVSAIESLGQKLSKLGGDTYQINGVTYDDGSNISSAVETLVRAARIERRI